MDALERLIAFGKSFWSSSSKFTRILIACGFSVATLITTRVILLKIRQKIYNLPPGPIGSIPLLNAVPTLVLYGKQRADHYLASFGAVASYSLFMTEITVINDAALAKQTMKQLKTLQWTKGEFSVNNANRDFFGKTYRTFRNFKRVLGSKEINAQNVEDGVKYALRTFIYPTLDEEADSGIKVDAIFKPLIFNLLNYAVTGFHLESIDDPFYSEFIKAADGALLKQIEALNQAIIFGRTEIEHKNEALVALKEVAARYLVKNQNEILTKNAHSFYAKLYNDYKDEEDELIYDCAVILQAALDSVSLELEYAILTLSINPDLQNMLYEELSGVFGEGEEVRDMKGNLAKLHSLQAFIHEILRFYPVVLGVNPRRVTEKNGIKIGGYDVGLNSTVGVNTTFINRDAKYWKHPNEFNIGNFLNEQKEFHVERGKNDALATFGFGPRACPGRFLAIKILNLVIASLVLRYRLKAPEEFAKNTVLEFATIGNTLLTKPTPSFPVTFESRHSS